MSVFDHIQTFFVSPAAVNGASAVTLVSVDLYFKTRPTRTNNRSGTVDPSVTVWLCETTPQGVPISDSTINKSVVNNLWENCVPGNVAEVKSTFQFSTPISLPSGKYYGIVIKFHDPDYSLWVSKQGDRLVETNAISPGPSGQYDGLLYDRGNSSEIREISSSDLKFAVNIAKYDTSQNVTLTLVPKDYEFFTLSSYLPGSTTGYSSGFLNGEMVFQQTANATGTVLANNLSSDLIGTGTSFSSAALTNNYIVITNGSINDIRKVVDVPSTTLLTLDYAPSFANATAAYKIAPVGKVFYSKLTDLKLFLEDSSSNTSVKFGVGNTVYGEHSYAYGVIQSIDDYSVDSFLPDVSLTLPNSFESNVQYAFSYVDGSNYYVNNALINTMNLDGSVNEILNYDGYIMSRTNEITNPYYLYANTTTQKSGYINVNLSVPSATNSFETPVIDSEKIDIFTIGNFINNDYTNEDTNDGSAISKYISTKVSFAENRFAEDIKVYLTAYKPATTDIRVYAKFHNSQDNEAFDTKSWTYLEPDLNAEIFSSAPSVNSNDYLDLSFKLPAYPPSNNTLDGFATTAAACTWVTTTADQSSAVKANDLIKIYNPGFPTTNYTIKTVASANSTVIVTLQTVESNSSINSSGFKIDVLKPKNTAFNNIQRNNIARYYNNSMQEFDNYNTFSIKIVLLADTSYILPRVNDLRAIGVSA